MMMNLRSSYCLWGFALLLTPGVYLPGMMVGSVAWAGERVEAKLMVEDVLALPGANLQLKSFLFREGLLGKRIGLGGENVEYFVQNRSIGKTMTGGDGKAVLEFVPRLRGNLTITTKVLDSPRVLDQEATGLLAVWEKRRPILIVDMVALLPTDTKVDSLRSVLPLNLVKNSFPEPHADATLELEKLGKFYYNLVYLYRSNSVPVEDVRAWLRKYELPMGIPMVVQTGPQALIAFLEQLKEDGWKNVSAGIGRTVEFAEIMVERRMDTVIIQEDDSDESFPRRAKIVNGWSKVRRHL